MGGKTKLVFSVIIIILILSGCVDSTEHKDNPKDYWIDLGELRHMLSLRPQNVKYINDLNSLRDANASDSMVIAIGDSGPLGDGEGAALLEFINSGGSALIATNTTYLNPVASAFGIKFNGHRIFSDNFYINSSFVNATTVDGEYTIITYRPTALEIFARCENINITVLSIYQKGEFDMIAIDRNDNGIVDGDEWPDSLPVVHALLIHLHNGGRAIFIGDTGEFTDDLIDRADNRAFISEMIDILVNGRGFIYYYDGMQSGGYSGHIKLGELTLED